MKKVVLFLLAVTMGLIGVAQDFESQMEQQNKIEQKSETLNLLEQASEYEKLARQFPERFEAKYYEALSLVFYAFEEKRIDEKEKQLRKAAKVIDAAMSQNKVEAELYILQALCFQAMIQVDPIKRGCDYSQKAEKSLARAFALDANNPRYYFLKGQNVFYTPEQYGGGKVKAKPLFEKAAKLFKSENRENTLDPVWGAEINQKQLNACKS